ncbi:predicted protein [Plenodomus lingam JN3]|uniref:Predicted protein n=1 Tax=Leptosphaeria maculans (strain JN3 / isolate v23.1.3 / race Av1-4-5-6-7-8) TaxID=985895 RepID=E4ZI35_LEPMJ|nr:predicted protein [Plenodomus lingam JN3]CBX91178.1 predicted protein [Plenodomus lingam JN3]
MSSRLVISTPEPTPKDITQSVMYFWESPERGQNHEKVDVEPVIYKKMRV